MATSSTTPGLLDVLTDVPRVSRESWRRLGWLRRYLLAVRAAVLPMTLFSCLLGGLLALPWTLDESWRLMLATGALLLAHAGSNLLNDLLGWALGLDRSGYSRLRYGAHPLAHGLIHPLTHGVFLVATAGAAALLGLAAASLAGPPAWWLAGVGALLLALYAWPLKRRGFGEACVLLVWGPLMVGGVYWVVSGDWGPEIAVLSLIFGLGPAVVVLAEHTDRRRDHAERGTRTLPVMLGARWAPRVIAAAAILQMTGGVLWAWLTGSWFYLLLLTALPALLSLVWVCARQRPTARPKGFPVNVWPLWYTAAGFRFARVSGAALVVGALLDGVW